MSTVERLQRAATDGRHEPTLAEVLVAAWESAVRRADITGVLTLGHPSAAGQLISIHGVEHAVRNVDATPFFGPVYDLLVRAKADADDRRSPIDLPRTARHRGPG